MVAVAQLVESRIVIPVVVGSSPISHPIKPPMKCNFNKNSAKARLLTKPLSVGLAIKCHASAPNKFFKPKANKISWVVQEEQPLIYRVTTVH